MKTSILKKCTAALLAVAAFGAALPIHANAAGSSDPVVVVSLGDSYSSGEGIPAFYGQEKAWEQRVYDEDWLAHRSTKSWPGLLEVAGISGTMKNYNVKETNSQNCKWYFGAASGAKTNHIDRDTQEKKTYKRLSLFKTLKTTYQLPKQIDIFNKVSDDVDYVTLTIGGNDVRFADIITTCATGSTYLHFGSGKLKLEKEIDSIWEEFDTTRANIKRVYKDIQSAAGAQANIIVAGYPKLLDKEGKGVLISEKEATIVNQNVTKFNNRLVELVNECKAEGLQIHFVDVEAEFDKDGGHQAYSDNAWINKIILTKQDQDLEQNGIASAYSVHPNEEGAKAYARCVNAKIREIENMRLLLRTAPRLTAVSAANAVTGQLCDADLQPLSDAVIQVYQDDALLLTTTTDANGNFAFDAADGDYQIEALADGYADAVTTCAVQTESTDPEPVLPEQTAPADAAPAAPDLTDAIAVPVTDAAE